MFEPEFIAKHTTLVFMFWTILLIANFLVLWFIGRMGDNINKIRKMLDAEIQKRRV